MTTHSTTARLPRDTRPLSLSNTCTKIITAAINSSLAQLCSEYITPSQQGFIKGRSLFHNVLSLEAHATRVTRFHGAHAGIVLLDITAAFPSLSHHYLFQALHHMGLPPNIIYALHQLYQHNYCHIHINGATHAGFTITSGIKQGCPASGSMFALALHPFLKYLASHLPPPRTVTLAFADDIAIVPTDLLQALVRLVKCLATLASATNLHLNASKTTIVPLRHTTTQVRAFILDNIPSLLNSKLADFGKYLGVCVGPAARCHQWDTALPKYTTRYLQTRSLPTDFFHRLLHYHTYALPTFTYLAQLQPPAPEVLKAESHALQLFTAGPYNAISTIALRSLCDLGYNTEAASIEHVSQASAFRLTLTLSSFHTLRAIAFEPPHDDEDYLLVPRCEEWHNHTCIAYLSRIYHMMSHISTHLTRTPKPALQRTILQLIRSTVTAPPWTDLIGSRVVRWVTLSTSLTPHTYTVTHTMDLLRTIVSNLPRVVTFATLRVMCNGINTSRRYQAEVLACPFCSTSDGDSLEHFATCPTIWRFAELHLDIQQPADLTQAVNTFFLLVPATNTVALCISVLHDLVVFAHNARTHGVAGTSPHDLMHGRLRHLSHRHPAIRNLLRGQIID